MDSDGIYAVIYRRGNDPWNVLFYAFGQCKDYGSCCTDYSTVIFRSEFIAKKTFSMFKLQSETRGEQTGLIDEMIGNQKIVQAFGHEGKT